MNFSLLYLEVSLVSNVYYNYEIVSFMGKIILQTILYCFFTGVGTKIEPTLCRADRLVGQVLGAVGALPKIFIELEISYYLLKRLLGVRTEGDKKAAKVKVQSGTN